ncbi:MAG: recombination mediator RecR [Erysipelotrichaceae bacterium]|jgi:recombination protein RecR|nr:recombination mediator RecR [Erysipelotrichaceae bacterium]
MYPALLERIIEKFQALPGVGQKTAERYAFFLLSLSKEEIENWAEVLFEARDGIKTCERCGNFSEGVLCPICMDETRDHKTICVVESAKDVAVMEKTGQYKGLYHVLGGLISAKKGILPDDLSIESLLTRVNREEISEVILATSLTIDGETTSLYLDKRLQPTGVKVTRIAQGLPMGGQLEYVDELTLIKALEGRKAIQ